MNKNDNINFIDLLKFILSLFVVAIHVHPFGTSASLSDWNFYITDCLGRIAVPFYFVCSAYFVFRKINLKEFDKAIPLKAALRFLRLYVVWSIIYIPLIIELAFENKHGILYGLVRAIRNFLFSGSYKQLWYLNALAFSLVLVTVFWLRK